MDDKIEFKCNKCGACCRNIGGIEEFEFLDNGKGICKYLNQETNLCTIYDFRPEMCRVDKMYKRYKSKMTYQEYIDKNYEACEELRKIEKEKQNKDIEIIE